jgi:hypothetical protein
VARQVVVQDGLTIRSSAYDRRPASTNWRRFRMKRRSTPSSPRSIAPDARAIVWRTPVPRAGDRTRGSEDPCSFARPQTPETDVDLRRTYDAVIVGSGAAGGMAAHVLTSHGLDVLLLEAGKKLDVESELKSMEWPYDHPRRGEKPYTSHALRFNEYTIRQPPYAKGSPWKTTYSYIQGGACIGLRQELPGERGGPSLHGDALRVGARPRPGRQDEHLGPPGPAPLRLRLQGQDPRRLRRRLAHLLRRTSRPTTTRSISTSASPAIPRARPPARQPVPEVHAPQHGRGAAAPVAGPLRARAHAVSRGRHHGLA